MSEPTAHTVIEYQGRPAFVVVPYDEYVALVGMRPDDEVYLPDEVVRLSTLEGRSLVRAWREHLGLTQREVAARLEVSQSAYAQMERPGANLRHATLKKIAAALEIQVEQLAD